MDCPVCPVSVWHELFITIQLLGLFATFAYIGRIFLTHLFKL